MTTFPDRMGRDGVPGSAGDPFGPGSCASHEAASASSPPAAIPIASGLIEWVANVDDLYHFGPMSVADAYAIANAAAEKAVAEKMAADGRSERCYADCAVQNAAYNEIMARYDAAKGTYDKVLHLPDAARFVPGLDTPPDCPACGAHLSAIAETGISQAYWLCDECDFVDHVGGAK